MPSSLFHIDSKYATSGHPGSYRFNLPQRLRNVSRVEVVYGEVPSSMYAFDRKVGAGPADGTYGFGRDETNTCVVSTTVGATTLTFYIVLTPGTYNADTLTAHLNAAFARTPVANENLDADSGLGPGVALFTYDHASHCLQCTRQSSAVWDLVSMPPVTGMATDTSYGVAQDFTAFNANKVANSFVTGQYRIRLATPTMLFLVISNLAFLAANFVAGGDIPRCGKGQLARFQMKAPQGFFNYFDTEALLEHGEVADNCNNSIAWLDMKWVDRDGRIVEFNGIHHTLQLRIFHS